MIKNTMLSRKRVVWGLICSLAAISIPAQSTPAAQIYKYVIGMPRFLMYIL
ncbi:MAG: hypothetical protein Q8Q25_00270 [bacterium]|nr:hypothetical protein [bacterium]